MMGISNLIRRRPTPGRELPSMLPATSSASASSQAASPKAASPGVATSQGPDARRASPIRAEDLASKPGWQELPPLESLVAAMPLVVTTDFDRHLGSRMSVLTVSPALGHILSPAAPAGLVDLVVTSTQPRADSSGSPDPLPPLDVARRTPANAAPSRLAGSASSGSLTVFEAPEAYMAAPQIAFTDAGRYEQVAPARSTQTPSPLPAAPAIRRDLPSGVSAPERDHPQAAPDVTTVGPLDSAASRPTVTDYLAGTPLPQQASPAGRVVAVEAVEATRPLVSAAMPPTLSLVQLPAMRERPSQGTLTSALETPAATPAGAAAAPVATSGPTQAVLESVPGIAQEPLSPAVAGVEGEAPTLRVGGEPTRSGDPNLPEPPSSVRSVAADAAAEPSGHLSLGATPRRRPGLGAPLGALPPSAQTLDPSEMALSPEGRRRLTAALRTTMAPSLDLSRAGSPGDSRSGETLASPTTGIDPVRFPSGTGQFSAQGASAARTTPVGSANSWAGLPLVPALHVGPTRVALEHLAAVNLVAPADAYWQSFPRAAQAAGAEREASPTALPVASQVASVRESESSVSAPLAPETLAPEPLVYAPVAHADGPAALALPPLGVQGSSGVLPLLGEEPALTARRGEAFHGAQSSREQFSPPATRSAPQRPSGMVEGSSVRSVIGHRHGVDLSSVPVDRSNSAFVAAERMGARGFTSDAGIAIPRQAGSLDDGPGAALLAHELTHVAQRLRTDRPMSDSSQAGASFEAEALRAEATHAATSMAAGPVVAGGRRQAGRTSRSFAGLPPLGAPVGLGDALPLASPGLSWPSTSPGGWERNGDVLSQPGMTSPSATSIVSAPTAPAGAPSGAPALAGAGVQMATKGSEPAPPLGQPAPVPERRVERDMFDRRPTEAQLSRLASWLYPLIVYKLRNEIRQGRERSGLLTDTYRRW